MLIFLENEDKWLFILQESVSSSLNGLNPVLIISKEAQFSQKRKNQEPKYSHTMYSVDQEV
jgi:hypothetical protein